MKKTILIMVAVLGLLSGCKEKTGEEEAMQMLTEIKDIHRQGRYQEALDSIESLRRRYPKAINARGESLYIWQEASLKMAQEDIAVTDSLLQATTAQMNVEKRIYERNMLGVKKDSLQARYEALIGVVRVIRKKMEEMHK